MMLVCGTLSSAHCYYRWNTWSSKSKKSIDWVHCLHSLSFWEIIFCLDMSAFLHLVSFCQPNHFFSNLSRREMGLSMTAIKIVPKKSNNCYHTWPHQWGNSWVLLDDSWHVKQRIFLPKVKPSSKADKTTKDQVS